jgi:threonine/homoserine/homoserine lactone efflux protein
MGAVWAFVGVAALVIVTPGPDTALTVRNALLGGRGAGIATAAGVALGLAVWTAAASAGLAARPRPSAALRQGLLNDLGNPKIAVFFTTLLPQFAPAHGPAFPTLLALGVLFCAMTFAWLCVYSVAVARAGRALRRQRIRRALDAVMGAALVAVGMRVAVERR